MNIWAFPFFYPSDKPGMRWAGTFAHRQYKGLIENGANLKVVIPVPWNPPYPFSELDKKWKYYQKLGHPIERVHDGISVFYPRIANIRPSRLMRKTYEERFIDAVAKFFKSQNIKLHPDRDIFYSQWLPESVFVQKAAHKLGVKSAILSIGDDVIVWPNKSKGNFDTFKQLLLEADMRFACADYLGKEANRLVGKDLDYTVVNWGVDYNYFKPCNEEQKRAWRNKYNIPQDKIVVLTIGSPIVRKGWLDLFDALKMLKADHKDFVLAGVHAGPKDIDLNEEAARRGVSDIFINLGEVAPDQLSQVYNCADIFCLPSHWEGLANVNIEAMSSGLPVITTDVCGHPELVKDGYNGLLIPPKQPAILHEKLDQLISDKSLRELLSKNGRQFIVEKWGNFVDNSKTLYAELSSK